MATNIEEEVQIVNNKTDVPQRVGQWVNTINEYLITNKKSPIDFAPTLNETIENVKSFAGTNNATGSGLIETRLNSPLTFVGTLGGVFIESGIEYKPNSKFNVTFGSFQLNGTFAQIACGAATENEISIFNTVNATLLRERAEIAGCEDVLARNGDSSQLINAFENALENEKLVISDRKSAVAVTSNASVAAINQTGYTGTSPIADSMLQMIGNIGALYSQPGSGHAFYLNQSGLSRLLREATTTGQFQNSMGGGATGYFQAEYPSGRRPTQGLVGYFDSYPVYLTSAILSTYTKNATGVITAQTGGTSTAVLFGLPYTLGLARGAAEYDTIQVFSPQNDRQSYYEGEITVGASTYMAAVLKAPSAWNYYAI